MQNQLWNGKTAGKKQPFYRDRLHKQFKELNLKNSRKWRKLIALHLIGLYPLVYSLQLNLHHYLLPSLFFCHTAVIFLISSLITINFQFPLEYVTPRNMHAKEHELINRFFAGYSRIYKAAFFIFEGTLMQT